MAHALSIQRIEKALDGKAPLSLHEYDVLLTIERQSKKRIRLSELASQSIFTKSGITRIFKRLETRGFVDRVKCQSDGRGVYACLNQAGAKALADTWALYRGEIIALLDPALNITEAKEFERSLSKIIDEARSLAPVRLPKRSSRN